MYVHGYIYCDTMYRLNLHHILSVICRRKEKEKKEEKEIQEKKEQEAFRRQRAGIRIRW